MFPESETLRTVDLLLARYRKPAIMLHRPYPPLNLPKTRSRLGGLPLLPDAFAWPRGRCNGVEVPLHFLAQIDCAELPRIDRRMPATGMMFFFGRDDEEQLWGDTKPQDDVRVIYAPIVAEDQPERAAPSDLLPIRGTYSPFPWVLPKEAGPSVHASWPVVPLRIDSWPDLSSIYGTETYRQIATPDIGIFGMFDRLMFAMKTGKRLPKPEGHRETAAARQKFEELYRRRLNAARVGAIVAATGLPTRAETLPTSWGKDVLRLRSTTESLFVLPSDLRMKPKPFRRPAS